jgi:NAD(P)-dependent dehydrogenase (short-subunit alcohol dehydrogenase family)
MAGGVLVTGASTGIGRACARELAARGFRVFAGVRSDADAESIRADGLEPLILDVTDADAIARARETIDTELGETPLAGIVNNAGVGVGGPLETLAIDDLRRQLEINTIAPVAVAQAFIPRLRRSHGRIVNMSSVGGRVGQPFLGPYSGSKFALEAISDAMRRELLPWGIRVALVEPGNVSTPIWDKGMAQVEEVRASATPETLELYGRNLDRMEKLVKLADKRGVPPEKVARAVAHAMTSSRPRARYLVGADARVQLALDRALPTRVADRLFSKIAGS